MAHNNHTSALDKPMSVQEIVQLASSQTLDPQYSMQHYFRTANLMVKQANIYEREGNDQMAYFLLYRHANLILDELNKHPYAKDQEHRKAWIEARKLVKQSLQRLEEYKPRINARHQHYLEKRRTRDANISALAVTKDVDDGPRRTSGDSKIQRPASPTQLDAHHHRDLAVELANLELDRRSGRINGRYEDPAVISDSSNARRHPRSASSRVSTALFASEPASHTSSYTYPSVPSANQRSSMDASTSGTELPSYGSTTHQTPSRPNLPPLPPKEAKSSSERMSSPPTRPSKYRLSPPPLPSKSTFDTAQMFASSATLESGLPLRTMFLPKPLNSRFLQISTSNTARNLETLGLLAGTLIRNALFITKLIIPSQTSTSDTCEMIDEASLHEYIEAQPEDLMIFGWIHTHPTQTCFMSSRDLHSHVWYQVSLVESIAIVLAPGRPAGQDLGVFRLTDPPGMGVVKTCDKTGIFHPHADVDGGLYTDCLGRPGHVVEVDGLNFETVDLRDGNVKGI